MTFLNAPEAMTAEISAHAQDPESIINSGKVCSKGKLLEDIHALFATQSAGTMRQKHGFK